MAGQISIISGITTGDHQQIHDIAFAAIFFVPRPNRRPTPRAKIPEIGPTTPVIFNPETSSPYTGRTTG